MATSRLRLYRRFPTLPESRTLLSLLQVHAIAFKTRYERGESYGRGGQEPDRLEILVHAEDYQRVQQLEAALTYEQALALADNYLLVALADDELRDIVAQAAKHPAKAVAAHYILAERKP